MISLRRAFSDINVGDVCTGTVSLFKLDTRVLLKRNVISKAYVRRHDGAQPTEEYIFRGFEREEEELCNEVE